MLKNKIPLAKAKQKNLGRKDTEILISSEFCLRIMNFHIPDFNSQRSSGRFNICCLISPIFGKAEGVHHIGFIAEPLMSSIG